jgi:hypothetical protein
VEITTKLDGAVNCPRPLKVQDEPPAMMLVGLLVIEAHGPGPSAALKPLPVTVTAVPIGPELGTSVIVGVGLVTVNVAEAKSPVEPVTVIKCAPNAAAALTVNDALTAPPAEMVHDPKVMIVGNGVSLRTQAPASAGLKPLPEIVTDTPRAPEFGLSVILAAGLVTVKDAVAKSLELPVTLIE